jgi:ligand-binding sensor protein
MLKISEFADMQKFREIMSNWAAATGLATVAVGLDGEYISDCYNFTDFCIKYTRGSKVGCQRCEQCDREGHGVYCCHAGLIDFGIDLEVNGQKVGSVIGGQVLPEQPDEEKFRQVAREIGVGEDEYIEALHHVNVRSESVIRASAALLGQVLNNFINAEYAAKINSQIIHANSEGASETDHLMQEIMESVDKLKQIQKRQKILALNASIEAARAGDSGAGFNVVAKEVGKLSDSSSQVNNQIETVVVKIVDIVSSMQNSTEEIDGNPGMVQSQAKLR